MTVTTETAPTTVTPIFDELAARLGIVWDVDTTEGDTVDEPTGPESTGAEPTDTSETTAD